MRKARARPNSAWCMLGKAKLCEVRGRHQKPKETSPEAGGRVSSRKTVHLLRGRRKRDAVDALIYSKLNMADTNNLTTKSLDQVKAGNTRALSSQTTAKKTA